jgi:hypothetical protein
MKRSTITPGTELATTTTRGNLRHKLRGAPPNIRRAIDAARQERGLDPLWPATPSARAAAVGAASGISSTIVVALAPGVSKPVALVGESQELPEIVSRRAWESVASQFAAGRHVQIRAGHEGGNVLGFTTGSRFRFRVCPAAGMLIALDVRGTDPLIPGGAGASIAFHPREVRLSELGGQTVRIIDELELDHIALIRQERRDRPVYPMSRVRRCRPADAADTMAKLRLDLIRELSAAWPGLRSIQR